MGGEGGWGVLGEGSGRVKWGLGIPPGGKGGGGSRGWRPKPVCVERGRCNLSS